MTWINNERRVVVTGMGIISPIGETLPVYLDSLKSGRSGITRWKQMDERIISKIGGDMSDFTAADHFKRVGNCYPREFVERANKILQFTPLVGNLTIAAALQAYLDAGLPDSRIEPERFAHVLGGANLNTDYTLRNHEIFINDPEYIEPLYTAIYLDTDVLSKVSELLNLRGPTFTVGNVCASGNMALLCGVDLLRAGRADAVVVTSTAPGIDPIYLQSLGIMNVLSSQSFNDEPWRASRPFDARREGFVPSEAAAAVVIETLDGARSRGARIHAEVLGGSATSDASRSPSPHVDGPVRSIRGALKDAGVNLDQIDYINSHGTSTIAGDVAEVEAIKIVFGEHAYHIPINSTKSMLGHCLWASALVELIATILQMQNDFVHPTINQEEKDPVLDLDFVPNEARDYRFNYALSNSFGFGGLNACVVVGRTP